jgi:hypothetical protein
VKALVTVLILAAVPSSPSGEFIVRLGEIFGGVRDASGERKSSLSFPLSGRTSVDSFRKIILSDGKLASCWRRCMKFNVGDENCNTDMGDVLSAASSCCEDSEGRVVVEQVMFLLCCSPSRPFSFERFLLLHADVLSDFDTKFDAVRLPSFLSEGVYKALVVTSMITGLSSEEVSRNQISSSQLQWLLENNPDNLPLRLKELVNDVNIFRPTFALVDDDRSLTVASSDASLAIEAVPPLGIGEDLPISQKEVDLSASPASVSLLAAAPASIMDIAIGIHNTIAMSGNGKIPFCV